MQGAKNLDRSPDYGSPTMQQQQHRRMELGAPVRFIGGVCPDAIRSPASPWASSRLTDPEASVRTLPLVGPLRLCSLSPSALLLRTRSSDLADGQLVIAIVAKQSHRPQQPGYRLVPRLFQKPGRVCPWGLAAARGAAALIADRSAQIVDLS